MKSKIFINLKRINKIKKNIKDKINLEEIVVIDNSSLHTKHKSFDPQKLHLKIIIKIKNMDKVIY